MTKRTIALCVALAASAAFAVVSAPASAVQLTHPTGTKLATGGKLLFTNVGVMQFKTPAGEARECTKSVLTGGLSTNGPEDITAEITSWSLTGTGREEWCTTPALTNAIYMQVTMDYEAGGKKVGLPYCLTSTSGTDKWVMRGGSCTSPQRSIKYKLDFYNEDKEGNLIFVGTCAYEKANLNGTFTTDTGIVQDETLAFNKEEFFKRIELSTILLAGVCTEQTEISTVITMETDTTSTADPIYVS